MSKIYFLGFMIFSLSLQINAQSKNNNINLKVFEIKKTSIRALQVLNEDTVWFAGANGKYGRIEPSGIYMDSVFYNNKPLNFRSIAFNGKHLFILSIENPALLYRFDPNNLNAKPKIVYQEHHEKVFYDSMAFFDSKNGIAMGDPTSDCLSVILTNDGGQTWEKINCKSLPETYEGEAAFAASDSNIAIYNNTVFIVTGGKKSRIFVSKNRAKKWKVYDTPIVQGKSMTGIFTTDFYDDKTGIIMGGNWEDKESTVATKALTNDGGKTWKLIDQHMLPGYISSVKYIPETKGKQLMAVSTEGIYQSMDGGFIWKKISDDGYYSIEFANRNTAWLSGNEKIAKLSLN